MTIISHVEVLTNLVIAGRTDKSLFVFPQRRGARKLLTERLKWLKKAAF